MSGAGDAGDARSSRLPCKCSHLVLAHAAMLFVTVAFSFWNVIGNVVTTTYCPDNDSINCPLVFAFYREVGAAPVLLVVCAASRAFVRLESRRDVIYIVGAGASLFGIQLFYILGLAWTNADVAAFYGPGSIAVVVFLALVLGMESYHCDFASVLKIAGVLLTLGGIGLIILDGEEKCVDAVNATACNAVRSNQTLCNGTIAVPGKGLVNASSECCRSCETASQSAYFVLGNVFLAANVTCCALFTIFQKLLMDPPTRGVCARHNSHAQAPKSHDGGVDGEHAGTNGKPRNIRKFITVITYAYCIAACCMVILTAIIRPPGELFLVQGGEAAGIVYVHHPSH